MRRLVAGVTVAAIAGSGVAFELFAPDETVRQVHERAGGILDAAQGDGDQSTSSEGSNNGIVEGAKDDQDGEACLRKAAGHLLLVAVQGRDAQEAAAVFDKYDVGGAIWLSNASAEDIKGVVDGSDGTRRFSVVDAEGARGADGRPDAAAVRRFRGIGEFMTPRAAGRRFAGDSAAYGRSLAAPFTELKEHGINQVLGPVLNVTPSRSNSGQLGPRTYGVDPETVSAFAGAYNKAADKAGLGTTAKHAGFEDNEVSEALAGDAVKRDRRAFALAAKHTSSVLVDGQPPRDGGVPASLQASTYKGLRDMGYKGPLVADIGTPQTLREQGDTIGNAVVTALESGASQVVIIDPKAPVSKLAGYIEQAEDAVVAAVNNGELEASTVNGALAIVEKARVRVAGGKPMAACKG
jgi:beta-N-acetylhexosaminidase